MFDFFKELLALKPLDCPCQRQRQLKKMQKQGENLEFIKEGKVIRVDFRKKG
jgi:hypothetical protein